VPRHGFYPPIKPSAAPIAWRPPSYLSKPARRIWYSTVKSMPGGHFQLGDMPLLADYAETVALLHSVTAEIWKRGPVENGVRSAYLLAKSDLSRQLATLTPQLRLAPRSRHDARSKPPTPTISAVDLAILQGGTVTLGST